MRAIRIPKARETAEAAEIENRVAVEHICKIVFHCLITLYGFIVMIDKPWLPWYLGGAQNIKLLYFDWPFT